MPQYNLLRRWVPAGERARVIENLQRLMKQLDRDIPPKDAEENLLLGTWNIRDFGKINRRGYGNRIRESHFYIAEILSRFDFVAVQEVNELGEWYDVMDILGPDWDFIATDVTDPKLGGNGERLLYLYDKRKVWFQKIAGEIVLPANMLVTTATSGSGTKLQAGKQFSRTPYLTAFQSGWFKFDICTVHIYYGESSGEKLQQRIAEIDRIARYLGRDAKDKLKKGRAMILLGDFNIVHPEHDTMKALTAAGFVTPTALNRPSNLDRTKYYDQIAFVTKPDVIEYIDRPASQPNQANAGIFEIFESIMREEDFEQFEAAAKASPNGASRGGPDLKDYYMDWRTYQISDHKPMWVRICSDAADAYLERLKTGTR